MRSPRSSRPWQLRRLCWVFALVVVACSDITDPTLDPRAEVLTPPTVYRRWWAMVESCSGLLGSFDRVAWYQVPGSDVVMSGNDIVGGYWAPVSNSIVLAGNAAYHGKLVRHEMLHALIRERKGHSRSYFVNRCAGVVSCISPCLNEVGPAPAIPSSIPRVTSSVLEIGMNLIPSKPSPQMDDGVFTVEVTARNPNSYAVLVTLDEKWFGRGFFYSLYGPRMGIAENEQVWDASLAYFGPGETKRSYFDLSLTVVPGAPLVLPGHYSLDGGFDVASKTFTDVVFPP